MNLSPAQHPAAYAVVADDHKTHDDIASAITDAGMRAARTRRTFRVAAILLEIDPPIVDEAKESLDGYGTGAGDYPPAGSP